MTEKLFGKCVAKSLSMFIFGLLLKSKEFIQLGSLIF